MISLLGIVIGLALFILLAYMGYNTIIVAIASAMVVAVFGGMNPFVALTEAFMPKTVGFMQGYFLIFLFSALFARFMGDTGAAPSIAVKVARIAKKAKNPDMQRWLAVMVLPLIQLILTYGGVNVFVVVFILVAIARSLFKDLNIPWWMYSCSCLGSSTVTIGMLPGSPQIQNIIPMQYFGTTTMSAPVLGILSSIITFAIGSLYIWWQCKRTNKKGEGFFPTGELIDKEQLVEASVENEKPLWQCLLPMIVVIVVLNVLKQSAVIAIVLLHKTPYGRKLYSVGINEEASRFSGINTGRVTFSVYLISAVIAAVSGFLLVGYTGTSFLDVGTSYNTKTIAAVVIGGTAITGGKGGYLGTIAGAVIMTILDDFLTIVSIPDAGRQVVQGIIIILLVLVYSREKKK